ncbi:alpha/beta hydrolase family protein [Alteromonas sp. CYL-A6]|uniref:alpha/beta hydrolase family protein n=1 Tax=Alteromonas nitratireducens TaxID=3390813 RepID=UPI0034B9B8E7
MNEQHIPITCADGTLLAGTLYQPHEVQGTVMIGPATGIKRQFYSHFARYLCGRGFAVLTYDNRGIGESLQGSLAACDASLIHWGRHDMTAVLDTLNARFPGLPHFLVGHSAGGQLVGLMENAHALTAMCNVGSSSGQLRNMRPGYQIKAHFFMNLFIPLSNLVFGYTQSHWVGMGEPLPRQVARQWQQWCNGQGYVKTAFGREITKHHYDTLSMPSRWLLANDDDIANLKNVHDMLSVFDRLPADIVTIEPAEHGQRSIGHMGFFSRRAQALWPLVGDFLLRHA